MEKLSPKEAGLERIRDLDVLSTIPEMLALQVEKRPDAVGWKSWDPVKKSWRDWTFGRATMKFSVGVTPLLVLASLEALALQCCCRTASKPFSSIRQPWPTP